MNRICIYTKDVQIITGKCDKTARAIINKIRKINNKQKNQLITIQELATFLGIKVEEIREVLKY
jgi:DNA-directed RNA polymerase specialized sigma subunit